jgi:hypothetical protein
MTTNFKTDIIEGAELLVTYEYYRTTRTEECHGIHTLIDEDINLLSVEVVIAGIGIDITDKLTPKQKQAIIHDLPC